MEQALPRFVFDQADTVSYIDMQDVPAPLRQILTQALPRVVIDQADSNRFITLQPPSGVVIPTPPPTPTAPEIQVAESCSVVVALGGNCGARTQMAFQTADLIDTYTRFRDETLQTNSTGQ